VPDVPAVIVAEHGQVVDVTIAPKPGTRIEGAPGLFGTAAPKRSSTAVRRAIVAPPPARGLFT
jgi:hypothetical protein